MQFHGQMVRVPVTARQKFDEAAFFYNEMIARRNNVIIFPYNLSAFLSAFRSVTYYLQKQYSEDARFQAWYPEKQREMSSDPLMKMLAKKRDGVVHREPLDLFYIQRLGFPDRFGDCIKTTHFEATTSQGDDGLVSTTVKIGPEGIEEPVPTHIAWLFEKADPHEVLELCYGGLERLNCILTELAGLRVSMGLPPDEEFQGSHSSALP